MKINPKEATSANAYELSLKSNKKYGYKLTINHKQFIAF
jgi:hypothetical protein